MPPENMKENYEIVAFMGQIPVRVRGAVNKGDYIIPSGLNDGTGVAVAPELLTSDELSRVVGQAWSSSSGTDVSLINVCVGISNKELGGMFGKLTAGDKKIASALNSLEKNFEDVKINSKKLAHKINSSSRLLNSLIEELGEPGYRAANKKE